MLHVTLDHRIGGLRRRLAGRFVPALCAAVFTIGCADSAPSRSATTDRPADEGPLPAFEYPTLSPEAFSSHLTALAHDSMQGRGTGQSGGEMAAAYLEQAFREVGLDPTPGSGTYRQPVPILATRLDPSSVEAMLGGASPGLALDPGQLIISALIDTERVDITAPLVFVGPGIVAPTVGWDDYAGKDVTGAFVVVHPGNPSELSEGLQAGAYELSRGGRAAAARQRGARGIIFLSPAGSEDRFEASRAFNMAIEHRGTGWRPNLVPDIGMTLGPSATAELLDAAESTWEAVSGGTTFESDLSLALSFDVEARRFTAPNIVGLVEGRGDGTVVVTAHYDAYGIGPADAEGDTIYNGAADNASGTAGLIELARDLAGRATPPERTVVFVATTAEEDGMLGARFYVDHPVGALEAIAVNLNVDGVGFSPPTDDFAVFPSAGTDASAVLSELAGPLGMSFGPQTWHEGMHFAFDHAEFLAHGIVGMTVWQGQNVRETYRDSGRGGGPTHTPRDDLTAAWTDEGIEQHLDLYRRVLEYYADGGEAPAFVEGHPFEAYARALGH